MDKKTELDPVLVELARQNPDSILAARIRLHLSVQRLKAVLLKEFEGTILYPIMKWWLNRHKS